MFWRFVGGNLSAGGGNSTSASTSRRKSVAAYVPIPYVYILIAHGNIVTIPSPFFTAAQVRTR